MRPEILDVSALPLSLDDIGSATQVQACRAASATSDNATERVGARCQQKGDLYAPLVMAGGHAPAVGAQAMGGGRSEKRPCDTTRGARSANRRYEACVRRR